MSTIARRLVAVLAIGTASLALASVLAMSAGAGDVSLLDAFAPRDAAARAILDVRFARLALSAIVGAGLGACGATLQALLRNPLADPYVLGTSGGAALFATFALAAGALGTSAAIGVPVAAFAGALFATFFVWRLASRHGDASATSVVLAGIVVNAFASAAITFVKVLVTPADAQKILFWLVGSIGYESRSTLAALAAFTFAGVALLSLLARPLQLLAMGEEVAGSLGVRVRAVRTLAFVTTSALVGALVAFAGLVGFVGLVVPHAVRRAFGSDDRLVVPASALFGAFFLVISDALARGAFRFLGTEPPVGAITAMVGCPVFLWLLRRRY
jgi:iron complex transport system permease protein